MSAEPITIRVADVDYDGPTAVELRRNVIALRNKALNPDSFEPEAAVILSHTVALLGSLIERTWPEMTAELMKARI
jgi:hypothetical protein